jgi:hypothetical protein
MMDKYQELRDALNSNMSDAEFAYCEIADKNTIRNLLAERDELLKDKARLDYVEKLENISFDGFTLL